MESTSADAMPDDTDLTPQAPEPEQAPAESSGATPTEPASPTNSKPPSAEANPVMELALKDLQERRDALEAEISALNSRKQQLETELKANFAGQSDAIARRVKGFQEYLGGALQDLVQSVENLELVVQPMVVQPSPLDQAADNPATPDKSGESTPPPAVADTFKPDEALIRQTLERFLKQPDVYADPGTCGAHRRPRHGPAGGLVLQSGRTWRPAQPRHPAPQHPGERCPDRGDRRAVRRSVPVSGTGRRPGTAR